ncbi:protein FAM184B isoform X4 [Rhineura floridana]|uniref:protein FAM184B isoform X4 n=1 Tax=Rhineura floridana TaxID=261503 RepID=UPI002AC83279|nr:protein FAM184B isoform X4 [Rhineura floridana]
MASGINKIHQLGTCDGSSKANNQCRSLAESDPDMHMKMCKKIAQLTKVIYALNAKNDEYEASIQALKEAHQEEIQHILAETRKTIPQYNSKAEELQKRVQDLEEALEKCRRLKEEAPSKFTKSKKQTKEGEPQREDKPIDEKIVLPKEMAHMKLSFEGHSSNNESDGLVNKHWVFVGDTLDCKGKLSEMYSMEMEAVMSEAAHLRWENQKLAGEYAEKISQLQASHEREKEIWRKAVQQSLADSGREWQQREMEQKKNYETREDASQQQVKKLEADLAAKSQQISEMKKHSQKLKEKMQDLETQLKEAQEATMESKSIQETLEEELIITKGGHLLQEDEILHKTEEMETALNSQSKARSKVDELRKQILPFQQTLPTKQSQGKQDGGDSQPMETAGLEIEAIKQQHNEEPCKIKHESDEEKIHLKEHLVKGLEDLVKKPTLEIKSIQASMDVKRKKLQKDVQIQLDELKKKYEYEIRHLQNDKEAVQGKLQDCSLEVLRLENFIRQNRDIPKYAEFLKSHARKTRERQQEDAFVQQQDISKQLKERAKGRVQLTTPLGAKNEEKSRLDSGGASKREDRQTLPHFQKEKSKEKRALQEEWYYQKTELQAQVTQLKQMLEQQANAFRDTLKEQELQSSKAREKLLQDLQDTIKQSQDIKAQLEASHQRAINLLKKSKNQELKEAEEYWKQKYHDSFKVQQQSHSLEIRALEEKAREELERELERMQKPQSLLIDSLRMELSEQQINNKEKDKLQEELKNMMAVKRQEEENHQNQIKFLRDELEKCQSEMSGLKKENSLLKDTKDLLSVNVELQKQTSGHLQDRESQLRSLLKDELIIKHKKEMDVLKQDRHKEFKDVMSDFSSSQALLCAKIVPVENELQELEGKERKREPRLEDLHLIDCLRDKLNEKEEMIKELMDGRKLQHSLLPSAEPCRNRSFSFNSKPITCLTTTAKQKKKMDEAPSRIVSVPNLASYAKSFLSGDLRPKKNPPQITKSTSLDQNPDCVRVCYPSLQALETKQVLKLQSNETSKPKDAQKPDPRHQEWFTKYFSF